ncbi:MAG TPA: dihydrofolate reductase family protein, partial [Alphaproteobacteria bacterium]|nr:dihydrofolate reductase family protein [Alphaproteobacteria bacterium]
VSQLRAKGHVDWSWFGLQLQPLREFNKDIYFDGTEGVVVAETDPDSPAAGIPHAATMNRLPKTVVSTTLSGDPGWNATVVKDDLAGAVSRLKAGATGDVYSFGGAGLANSLVALDLVDEYRLMVTPGLLGDGKRMFEGGLPRIALDLIEAKPLDTGAVILHYRRDREA